MQKKTGVLYIVATPIGNLADISHRALSILADVSVVYAEDTRHSRKLLNAHGIEAKLVSLHEHNEKDRVQEVLNVLQSGDDAALVSDAGTPLINDPGYKLVEKCHEVGIDVSPIPGPSAIISALSVSGIASDSFIYLGFPPAKQVSRQRWLSGHAQESKTMVFYESKHRIISSLEDMVNIFDGNRLVTVARELTKRYETINRGTLSTILEWIKSDENNRKGEFVIVVAGSNRILQESGQSLELLKLLLPEVPLKKAVEITVKTFGEKKNSIYKLALTMTGQEG